MNPILITFEQSKPPNMSNLQQLKLLVNLARADGEITEKEKQFILNIGQANHLMVAEILPLFSGDHPDMVAEQLSGEEKFDCIVHLVQLMKIDEKLYREEIKYCAQVASKLGFSPDVLFELMLKVKGASLQPDEVASLRNLAAAYLLG